MAERREPPHLRARPPAAFLDNLARRMPEVDPVATALVLGIVNTGNALTSAVRPYFDKLGLTEARFTLVMSIYRLEMAGPTTPSQLAKHIGVGRAAMTQLLDALADDGWIERETHPDDRRKIQIRLARNARRRLERFLPHHYQRLTELVSSLTRAEQTRLLELVSKLERSLYLAVE